jgi:hypothetical protein
MITITGRELTEHARLPCTRAELNRTKHPFARERFRSYTRRVTGGVEVLTFCCRPEDGLQLLYELIVERPYGHGYLSRCIGQFPSTCLPSRRRLSQQRGCNSAARKPARFRDERMARCTGRVVRDECWRWVPGYSALAAPRRCVCGQLRTAAASFWTERAGRLLDNEGLQTD